jgi:hypothetical protein
MGIEQVTRFRCDGEGCGFEQEVPASAAKRMEHSAPVRRVMARFEGIHIDMISDGYLCIDCRTKLQKTVGAAWSAVLPEIPF